MTVASFGGPFMILAVVRGGESARWPPDRLVEWVTIGLVFGVTIALFCWCVTLPWWHHPRPEIKSPKSSPIHSRPPLARNDLPTRKAPDDER
jgi:hypothetical protein